MFCYAKVEADAGIVDGGGSCRAREFTMPVNSIRRLAVLPFLIAKYCELDHWQLTTNVIRCEHSIPYGIAADRSVRPKLAAKLFFGESQ
jgi:hypothetical protein